MSLIGSSADTDACDARPLEVDKYHSDARGENRGNDINISRPAGVVSARENNSGNLATFRGQENLRRTRGR